MVLVIFCLITGLGLLFKSTPVSFAGLPYQQGERNKIKEGFLADGDGKDDEEDVRQELGKLKRHEATESDYSEGFSSNSTTVSGIRQDSTDSLARLQSTTSEEEIGHNWTQSIPSSNKINASSTLTNANVSEDTRTHERPSESNDSTATPSILPPDFSNDSTATPSILPPDFSNDSTATPSILSPGFFSTATTETKQDTATSTSSDMLSVSPAYMSEGVQNSSSVNDVLTISNVSVTTDTNVSSESQDMSSTGDFITSYKSPAIPTAPSDVTSGKSSTQDNEIKSVEKTSLSVSFSAPESSTINSIVSRLATSAQMSASERQLGRNGTQTPVSSIVSNVSSAMILATDTPLTGTVSQISTSNPTTGKEYSDTMPDLSDDKSTLTANKNILESISQSQEPNVEPVTSSLSSNSSFSSNASSAEPDYEIPYRVSIEHSGPVTATVTPDTTESGMTEDTWAGNELSARQKTTVGVCVTLLSMAALLAAFFVYKRRQRVGRWKLLEKSLHYRTWSYTNGCHQDDDIL